MHFSIPDTQELTTENGSTYTGYNIHVNGVYHCTVRYKQLHNLHEQLRRKCGNNLPIFPPKKLLPLSASQLLERRALLEKYIQSVGQESRLMASYILSSFLRSAQQETMCSSIEEKTLDVYLMNGYQIKVTLFTTDQTQCVLNSVCKQLNLPQEYVDYFALFVIKKHESGETTIVRKLENFESPYISQKLFTSNKTDDTHRIYLRKMYWDCEYDLELMCHPVSLHLLYVQTVSDIERSWVICTRAILAQLADLQSRGAKQQYLELARTLKYYGYMQFGSAISDYPDPNSRVIVAIGNRQLSMRLPSSTDCNTREGCFKVTRMRCWRLTTTHSTNPDSENCDREPEEPQLKLSFEYLISKDKMRWINITSTQVIFMSVCLQSMVDELLLKKNGTQLKHLTEQETQNTSWSYMRRDGSTTILDFNSINGMDDPLPKKTSKLSQWSEPFSIKKLQKKFSSSTNRSSGQEFVGNEAFEDIGDEDL